MLISETTLGILARMGEILTESFQLVEETAEDKLELIMGDTLAAFLDEYEIDEDDAVDFMFFVADELSEDGKLPPFPEEEASEEEVAAWVGAASALGYTGYVLKMADEYSDEDLEEAVDEDEDRDCEGDCECEECSEQIEEAKGTPKDLAAQFITAYGGKVEAANKARAEQKTAEKNGAKELASFWADVISAVLAIK